MGLLIHDNFFIATSGVLFFYKRSYDLLTVNGNI